MTIAEVASIRANRRQDLVAAKRELTEATLDVADRVCELLEPHTLPFSPSSGQTGLELSANGTLYGLFSSGPRPLWIRDPGDGKLQADPTVEAAIRERLPAFLFTYADRFRPEIESLRAETQKMKEYLQATE